MRSRNVVLVDGVRSAFARGGRGRLVASRLDEAGANALRALLDRVPKVSDDTSAWAARSAEAAVAPSPPA